MKSENKQMDTLSQDIMYVLSEKDSKTASPQALGSYFNENDLTSIYAFHKSFPQYEKTPLHQLKNQAETLGLSGLYVKDESLRFGLNAFKVLGGTYAVAKYIATTLNLSLENMSFENIKQIIKERLGSVTFVTATDGNHGRGVAWAANQLDCPAVVFMPKGSSPVRLENIRKEGAKAEILDVNYDGAVQHAKEYAEKNNGVLIQDTAWDGYEDIPSWIMQGYTTIMSEVYEQIETPSTTGITHVFVQAGVGSYPSSIVGYLRAKFGQDMPICIVVEPHNANCIYKSAKAGDGKAHTVAGDLNTIMAGLACGTPSSISWPILRDYCAAYISCSDEMTKLGMRTLANPLDNDPKIISGESGAVGMGLISKLMKEDAYADFREKLALNEQAKVLIISTEGDTDPDHYKKIVG